VFQLFHRHLDGSSACLKIESTKTQYQYGGVLASKGTISYHETLAVRTRLAIAPDNIAELTTVGLIEGDSKSDNS